MVFRKAQAWRSWSQHSTRSGRIAAVHPALHHTNLACVGSAPWPACSIVERGGSLPVAEQQQRRRQRRQQQGQRRQLRQKLPHLSPQLTRTELCIPLFSGEGRSTCLQALHVEHGLRAESQKAPISMLVTARQARTSPCCCPRPKCLASESPPRLQHMASPPRPPTFH